MNGNTFRMPARRLVTAAAATALAAGPAVLAAAGPAHATGGQGRASAAVLRTTLDVSLLDRAVRVPLTASLNEVRAPHSARKTALTARLDGVDGGKPFSLLRAEVADATATVTPARAEARTDLARARVHVPGLPLLSVIEVDKVTSRAVCATGKAPVASATVPGTVTVLGRKVTLTAGGTTHVRVPGVGEVKLDLSQRRTTSRSAAATAVELTVSVNPLKLNVAEAHGTVTLATADCKAPVAPHAPETPAGQQPAPAEEPAAGVRPQGDAPAGPGLAETGGNSATPYVAGGALALVVAGGGALALARRRRG
ncbi:LPXTG cell wall anchor domain-containing protein [Streptomyces sp. PRKS01-65]|nr:SCO1860 family LAETG-anchored protein [Streptomyces harenosi]NEY31920.1 LPXTG cell wall anchor domain-containing protein [Streptomyces harenosi]